MIVKSTAAAIGALGLVFTATIGPAHAGPSSVSALATPGAAQSFVSIMQLEEPGTVIGHHHRFRTGSP